MSMTFEERDKDPHHALNNLIDDLDETEWPDPYEKRLIRADSRRAGRARASRIRPRTSRPNQPSHPSATGSTSRPTRAAIRPLPSSGCCYGEVACWWSTSRD